MSAHSQSLSRIGGEIRALCGNGPQTVTGIDAPYCGGVYDGYEHHGSEERRVWIFHGEVARFASGVFGDKAAGLEWIARHGLAGILTEYEVGDGCYDLAVRQGRFRNTEPHHGSPDYVAGFSPGRDHNHVRDGRPDV